MGKILSLMSRPIKNYNIESRAHKVISRDKPVPAPKHKSDVAAYEKVLREHPEIVKDLETKHQDLDERLRDVYIVSHDPVPKHVQQQKQNPDRPLPVDRKNVATFEYGFKEPEKIPLGRVTLKNALKFINDHQTDARLHSAAKISDEYLLPEETVKNILTYYNVFEVYIPEQRQVKASFAGPRVARTTIQLHKIKQLGKGGDNT